MSLVGVVLGGGNGTRLYPYSIMTHKHLLPMGSQSMIEHPLDLLADCGCEEIIFLTHADLMPLYHKVISAWHDKGGVRPAKITYIVQPRSGPGGIPPGIAQGLNMTKDIVGDRDVLLCLGDNIFTSQEEIVTAVKQFTGGVGPGRGHCRLFLRKTCSNMKEMGVVSFPSPEGSHFEIIEKPSIVKSSHHAVVGLYLYSTSVFEKMKGMVMSARGEFEITDINNKFCSEGSVGFQVIHKGWWFDIGSPQAYRDANLYFLLRDHPGIDKAHLVIREICASY